MNKPIIERISYYTRKVAERGSLHPSKPLPNNYKYRAERLMKYKNTLNELIRNQKKWAIMLIIEQYSKLEELNMNKLFSLLLDYGYSIENATKLAKDKELIKFIDYLIISGQYEIMEDLFEDPKFHEVLESQLENPITFAEMVG